MSKRSYSYAASAALGEDVPKAAPFLRSEYNYDTDLASLESALVCLDESRAKQSFLEETDINTIVRRFGITGQMPQGVRMPTYDDFTEVVDFQSAMEALVSAEASFMRMPVEIRTRFQNNPALFVDFCSDAANREEAIKLGLVPAPAVASSDPPGNGGGAQLVT